MATWLRTRPDVGRRRVSPWLVSIVWRGLGHRYQEKPTRSARLRGYVLVDYMQQLQSVSQRAGLGWFIVSKYEIPRQVDSSALGTSLRRQTRGSQREPVSLGPTPSAAHSARLFAAPDRNNSSRSRRLLESLDAHIQLFRKRRKILLRVANCTTENMFGVNI